MNLRKEGHYLTFVTDKEFLRCRSAHFFTSSSDCGLKMPGGSLETILFLASDFGMLLLKSIPFSAL